MRFVSKYQGIGCLNLTWLVESHFQLRPDVSFCVISNYSPVSLSIHTFHTYMAFLHCARECAPAECYCCETCFHIYCKKLIFLLHASPVSVSSEDLLNLASHCLQSNSLSFLWLRRCDLNEFPFVKECLHWSQWKVFSLCSCLCMCDFRLLFVVVAYSHWLHAWGSIP